MTDQTPWLMRHNKLAKVMSISPAQLTRMVADGTFPAPIELTPGVTGGGKAYATGEVLRWLRIRLRQRDDRLSEREAKGHKVYRSDTEDLPDLPDPVLLTKLVSALERQTGDLETELDAAEDKAA